MTITRNQESGIELQDISREKIDELSVVTQVAALTSDDYYQLFWTHYKHYLFGSETTIFDLYQACENLLKSSAMGNNVADAQLRASQNRFLAHEFSKSVDLEFSTRLEAFNTQTKDYVAAQNSLFILYYSKRYHTIYSSYSERYQEIFQALQKMNKVSDGLDPHLADFARHYIDGFPHHMSYETLKSATWKIVIHELLGEDPLLAMVQKHKDQDKKLISPGSPYPFKILSPVAFTRLLNTVLASDPDFVASATRQYCNYIQVKTTKFACRKQSNGTYQITISSDLLDLHMGKILYFVNDQGDEIARFEMTDNKMYFKGHGNNINLKIEGVVNVAACFIENTDAEVNFTAEFNQSQPLYFSSDLNMLTFNGDMISKDDIKFDILGGLCIASVSSIITPGAIDLRARSLDIDGKIVSHAYFQSTTEGVTTISHRGSCYGESGVIMSALSFNKLLGEITSNKNLIMKAADGAYIHGSAYLSGTESFVLDAKSIFITDKAIIQSDHCALIKAQATLIIEKQSQLKAESLKLDAKYIKNYSPHIKANKIIVHCEEALENHATGVLTSQETQQFVGGSVWNGGKLKFGKRLDAKLNKVFVHGVASLSKQNIIDAVKYSSIEGEDMSIVAGVVFGALGSTYVRSQTISAIAELGAGLSTAKYTRKSRLISFECNIELPNLVVIYKDLNDFCQLLQKGDYENVLKSIFSFESLTNAITVARWIVRTLAPGAGKGIDLVWSTLILISSLPNLYYQCRELYQKSKQGQKVEYYDLYKLVSTVSGVGIQALNLEGQVASDMADGLSSSAISNNILNDIPALSLSFASLFMPANTDESILGVTSGISANGSLMRRNMLSYEMWHTELGVNLSHNFEVAKQCNQVTLANNVSNIGHELSRNGHEMANVDVVSVDLLDESSTVEAQTVTWMTEDLTDNADVHAKTIQVKGSNTVAHGGKFIATELTQLSGGTVSTSSDSQSSGSRVILAGDKVYNGGTSNANQFFMTGLHYAESTKTSHTSAQDITEYGKVVKQGGAITVLDSDTTEQKAVDKPAASTDKKEETATESSSNQVASSLTQDADTTANDAPNKGDDHPKDSMPPEPKSINPHVTIRGEESAELSESATLEGKNADVVVQADKVTDAGKADVNGLYLLGKTETNLTQSAQSTVNSLLATAKIISQQSQIALPNNSQNTTSEVTKGQPVPNIIFDAEESVELGEQSKIDGLSALMYIKTDHATHAGKTHVKNLIVDAKTSAELTETSELTVQRANIHAKDITLAGKISLTNALHLKPEAKNPDEKETKNTETPSEEKQLEPDLAIQADKNLMLSKTSHIDGENAVAYLSAENIKDNGEAKTDTFIEHATSHLETGASASHVARSLISLQAPTASLKGAEVADTVDFQIEHGLDVNQLLSQIGDFSHVKARGILSIHTNDQYTVDRDLNLAVEVALTCAGFDAASKSILDSKNLSIRTTYSGVALLNSKMRSDGTLSIYSTQGLHSEGSNISANILGIETLTDICQFGSTLHGDTYTQILDHGRLINAGLLTNGPNGQIYTASNIQGGTGVGYDGTGAYLVVDGTSTNLGSHIDSIGHLYFNAKKGLANLAVSYQDTVPGQVKPSFQLPHSMNRKDLSQYLARRSREVAPTVVSAMIASQIQSNGRTFILSDDGDVLNTQSRIVGNETYLHTPHGKITNLAGFVQAYNYLELIANGNIENLCLETTVQGRYSPMSQYDIGHFIGGIGEGHDGNGLVAASDARIINDASEISSMGNNVLSGKQGVSSTARYNKYISYYRHDKSWCGKESTTIDWSYQLQSALVYSANGSNTLISALGAIDSCSTAFIAAQDNNFSAKGPVRLDGYVLSNKEYKDKSQLWRVVDHKTTQVDDVAAPTIISNPGNTNIVSLSDVELLNASVHTGGKFSVAARNILLSAPTLNHTVVTDSRGVGFNYPASKITNASPLYCDYQAMKGSHNGIERAANVWNMGFDGLTSVNNGISGLRSNSLAQTLFPASYLTSAEISYTRTKSSARSQSVASNAGLDCGELDLNATDTISFANGIPVYVTGDAHIHAKIFSQSGAQLHGSVVNSSQGVTVGVSLQSNPNVGVNASGSQQRSTYYANQVWQVGGRAIVDCDQWYMTNANLMAASLVDHSRLLSIISSANQSTSSSWSACVNTNGSYSFQNSHNRSAQIGVASGIYTTEGSDITTDLMHLEGAQVVSDGISHISASVVESVAVEEYNRGRTYGLAGNANDVVNCGSVPLWQPSISNITTTLGKQDYRATQQGTLFAPNRNGIQIGRVSGQLNTANRDGLIINHDDHYNVQLKIPVVTSSGLKQMSDNFAWARDKAFAHVLPSAPILREKKQSVLVDLDAYDKAEDDFDDGLSAADLAKQSRLSRWKKTEFDGLAGEANTSKWAGVVFDDQDIYEDIDSGSELKSHPNTGHLAAVEKLLAQVPKKSEEYDFLDNPSPIEKATVYGVLAALSIADGIALAGAAVGAYRFGRAGLTFWRSTTDTALTNNINLLRLQHKLTLDEAGSIFTEDGGLTEDAILESLLVIPATSIRNNRLLVEFNRRSGSINDWAKYVTQMRRSPSGNYEMHFYRNEVTGDVYYGKDYKAVFQHQGKWNCEIKPKFNYTPTRFIL